jgi:His-Xaa-Ser repeat protein HxsA
VVSSRPRICGRGSNMRLKFLIPSLLAAGFVSPHSLLLPAVSREDAEGKNLSLFDIFRLEHKYNFAAHRSHSSHGSHGSHRSSSGGYRAPAIPTPPRRLIIPAPPPQIYNPTPPQQILPLPPAAPKTLPGLASKLQGVVIQVQTCLSLYGFYSGIIDGMVGPETAAAISKFQEQWSLPITGTITPQVLDACGISAK